MQTQVRVWDFPVRIVHWLLVVLVPLSWWTAESGRMDWHRYSGYALLGLITFRLYWGFAGSSTARFSHFVRGPRAIARYLRGAWGEVSGHNPIGALNVVILLALLAAQVALGLFAVDVDGIESGPLSVFVSFDTGRAAASWHEQVFDLLTAFIVLHLVAVAYYSWFKRQKLVAAMVHGRHAVADHAAEPVVPASTTRFIIGVALACAMVWAVARL
jgi:cytochrome b